MEESDLLQLLKIICDVLAEYDIAYVSMDFAGARELYGSFKRPVLRTKEYKLIEEPESTTILETRITLPYFRVNVGWRRAVANYISIQAFLKHAASFFTLKNYACGNGGHGYLRISVNSETLNINTFSYNSDAMTTGSWSQREFKVPRKIPIEPVSGKLGPNLKSIRKVRTDGGT